MARPKKAFSEIGMDPIYTGITDATSGQAEKLPRLNIQYSPENYEFLRVMARGKGCTITELANASVDEYRAKHEATYTKIKTFFDSLTDDE